MLSEKSVGLAGTSWSGAKLVGPAGIRCPVNSASGKTRRPDGRCSSEVQTGFDLEKEMDSLS